MDEHLADRTRVARVMPAVAPLRSVDATSVARLGRTSEVRLPSRPVDVLFRESQRAMAKAVSEEERKGVFIFAVHQRMGDVARLWLQASRFPRAGHLGRHDSVDLALPLDDALSLRHVLFVVRRTDDAVRTVVMDLRSSDGLQLEDGQQPALVEVDGFFAVRASDFILFGVPTGERLPWDPDATDPWETLRRGRQVRREAELPVGGAAGPGRLVVRFRNFATELRLDEARLRRGVLLGRDPRCDVAVPLNDISRVHAAVLWLDDRFYVVDTGSTNGLWRKGQREKIGELGSKEPWSLAQSVTIEWRDWRVRSGL